MQKEANLTRNMNSQERGQRSTSNIDLGQYKSSHELLRVFQIKREKVLKNIGGSNAPMTEAKGEGKGKLPNTKQVNSQAKAVAQFKLSDFAAADQRILDSTRELGTTKKISDSSSNTQPNIPTQSRTTTEGSRDRQQLLKATIAGNDISMQKHQQKKRAISESHTSREKEQPKKRMVEYDTSRDIQQLKKTSAGNNLSKQKHQEKTRAISENHTSREKEQSKKTMVEYDGSRDIQQVRKTSAGNDLSKQKHQEKRRVISENHTSSEKEQPKKRIPLCRSMTIDEFLKEKGEVNEELENESDDEEYDPMEEEEEEEEDEEEEEEEVGNFEINGNEIEGTRKKRTRGPTRCLKIHARTSEDRQEVTLDEDGEPIGPNDKTVSDLSYFLGTLARNAEFCPLIYTNFKALLNDRKDRLWKYVNDKYIISDRGQKAVFSRINDAWRSYKSKIKKSIS